MRGTRRASRYASRRSGRDRDRRLTRDRGAAALDLARQGARVLVNYQRNADAAQEVVAAITAAGVRRGLQGRRQRRDRGGWDDRGMPERWGHLELLVNNAGITADAPTVRLKEEQCAR